MKNSSTESVLWCAPWFAGLDARYVSAIQTLSPSIRITLLGTQAGLTRVAGGVAFKHIDAGIRSWKAWRQFARLLVSLPAHENGFLDDTWDPRFILLWLLRSRHHILLVHDVAPHDRANTHRWAWQGMLKRAARARAKRVICYSGFVRDEIRTCADFKDTVEIIVVPLVAELDCGDARTCAANPPELLVSGRITEYKGVPEVLLAWSQLRDQFPQHKEARLVIAGAGALSAVNDSGIVSEGVIVLDKRLAESELIALHARAAGVVLYYRKASQSGILCLANSLGVPAITSAAGALPEYQPNPALIATSLGQLVVAMARVLGSERSLFSSRAADFARDQMSVESAAEALLTAIATRRRG